ncbi:conserved hypothetical protein [uncultured Eubacteriales bacterium]|uniref:Uncharacterized protein n=1 Tax=uncultured Eubacteriales bacterium TaxID=172733 RepID=A0A212JY75_9FIRM|nr:conserved hypothetical protein [uncultured Eubacteriales bacterium]
MELLIHFKTLPDNKTLDDVHGELTALLADDGWLTGICESPEGGCLELELEDERANPKHGILAVKHYLQSASFAPDTTIELSGVPVGIYE